MNVLRSKVQLQEKVASQGALGQTVVWKPVQDLHARVIPLDVKTIADYMQLSTQVTHKVVLRGTVEVELGKHRFLYGSMVFEPQSSAKHYDGVTEVVCLSS